METGDATSLEANKIAVESISARTAADLNRAELQAKIQQLNTMTGDSDDSFEDVTYPCLLYTSFGKRSHSTRAVGRSA